MVSAFTECVQNLNLDSAFCVLEKSSSTGVHGAPKGTPKYAWGAPLRRDSQRCITNLLH